MRQVRGACEVETLVWVGKGLGEVGGNCGVNRYDKGILNRDGVG